MMLRPHDGGIDDDGVRVTSWRTTGSTGTMDEGFAAGDAGPVPITFIWRREAAAGDEVRIALEELKRRDDCGTC